MSKRYGDGNDCIAIPSNNQTISGTTPIVSRTIGIRDLDSVSFQLITDFQVDEVTVDDTDNVVASTKRMTLANYDFTGKTGATVRISGSSANDGDHIVTSVVSTHVAAFSGSTFTDETFDPETVTIEVIRTDDAPAGDWLVEVSNNYQPGGIAAYGQIQEDGDWTDITSEFSPDIASVTGTTILENTVATQTNQFVQANVRARDIRVTFTPTDGNGKARANINGKSWG